MIFSSGNVFVFLCMLVIVGSATNTTKSLHFIPDHDGLISQYLQVENLLTVAQSYGRSLLEIHPFTSLHFNDSNSDGIILCDIFRMPLGVSCHHTPVSSYRSLLRDLNCTFLGPHLVKDFRFVAASGLKVPATKHFDFSSGRCVIGSAWKWNGFRPASTGKSAMPPPGPILFQPRYLSLLRQAMVLLGVKNKRLEVFHWRRGDQLYTRCIWKNQFVDRSVNCKSAEEFAAEVRGRVREGSVVYVATNERSPEALQTLSRYGILHFASHLQSRLDVPLSQLDVFVVELLLMGAADAFTSIGRSNLNLFMKRLRAQSKLYSVCGQLQSLEHQ